MPLNHLVGEKIEGLDPIYRVVPAQKYKDKTRLTTTVLEWSSSDPKKFKTQIPVERPIWQAALGHAQICFVKAGADPSMPLKYDVIAQEYPRTNEVAFLFCAKINGVEHYADPPPIFALSPQQIASLTLSGDWKPFRVN